MAKEIHFPYGKEKLKYSFDEKELAGILTSSIEEYEPQADEITLVKRALENPVGSPKLSELSVGKKKDFTSIPYSKIQAIAVETAGVLDLDSELEICISGLGTIKFDFSADTNISSICKIISQQIL